MKDIKKILKELPEEQSPKITDNVIFGIIKRETERFKEKRISLILIFLFLILGTLGIKKFLESAEFLDSWGFWEMARKDFSWVDLQAFLEGNPVIEGLFLLFITLMITVPIWVYGHKDKKIGR